MSQTRKLEAFAQAVGEDVKHITQNIGRLDSLQTAAKNSLTAAVNEIAQAARAAAQTGGAVIDDGTAGASTTYSGRKIKELVDQAVQTAAAQGAAQAKNDILGGEVAAELDTLREIAAELAQNKTAAAGIAQKLTEHKNSIDAIESTLNTDLAAVYNRAKTAQ